MVSTGQRAFADASSANWPASSDAVLLGAVGCCVGAVVVVGAGLCGAGAGAASVAVGADRVGAGAGAAAVGLGSGAAALGAASPALHCSTYAFWVTPRACMPALSALHSATHSLAVFCEDDVLVGEGVAAGGGP